MERFLSGARGEPGVEHQSGQEEKRGDEKKVAPSIHDDRRSS
jgi:hypothetical protein